MAIKVDVKHLSSFLNDNEFQAIAPQVKLAHDTLHNGTGLGNDFIGWVTPVSYTHLDVYKRQSFHCARR